MKAAKKLNLRSNRRKVGAPEGGSLAPFGYYAAPVQAVVRKWQTKMPLRWIEHYFPAISLAALKGSHELNLRVVAPCHWPFVWEMAAALEKVRSNKSHPNSWLLLLPIEVTTNGKAVDWKEIRDRIKLCGGPEFSAAQLRNSYKRLRLVTPPHVKTPWLA